MFDVKRIIYGLIGLAALWGTVSFLLDIPIILSMPIYAIILIVLLLIGGLNWGIVAITGEKDIFELIGL